MRLMNSHRTLYRGVCFLVALFALGPARAQNYSPSSITAYSNPIKPSLAVDWFDNVIPQVVEGGGWKTTFFLTNLGSTTAYFDIYFMTDNGDLMALPLSGYGATKELTGRIPPYQSIEFETPGSSNQLFQGSAQIFTLDKPAEDPTSSPIPTTLGGYAIFRQRVAGRPDFEAVVPVSPMFEQSFVIGFDNRSGYSTGVAVINAGSRVSPVLLTVRDNAGLVLMTDSFSLQSSQKLVFSVLDRYPALREKSGVLQFSTTNSTLTGLGLRFNPGGAFTSIHSLSLLQ